MALDITPEIRPDPVAGAQGALTLRQNWQSDGALVRTTQG